MSKDPVFQLIDEITLIRGEVQALKRTSLDREEAEKLNELLVESVDRMAEAAIGARRAVRSDLEADRAETARLAVQSATEAAQRAVKGVKGELEAERRSYALSLSEARKAARRAGLQSWPWIGGLLATGALLGALMAYGTETAKSVLSVRQEVRTFCGITVGQVVEREDGSRYCASWIVTPEQAARRRAREEGTGG
ncbi:hypothetical protein [Jannaschia rubra]|uniref:hypothetical protein n=1 Tax=Jannaschia rubra TaxID=282197 RepID=UPI0008DFD059|nr:hypothetical protein [Jannaschia rubra]SFG83865.1 hypothetical protein SAMN04488517_1225 [Jannaschia rubra]